MSRAFALAWAIALVLVLLSACGGGDEEPPPEDPPTTEPVDCRATPERCR